MKKLSFAVLALLAPLAGYAGNYTFDAGTSLNSLQHNTAYTWALGSTSGNDKITSFVTSITPPCVFEGV